LLSPRVVHSLTRPIAVVAGDICDAVAAAHNVNTTLLYENNPQIDPECSNIYIDEVLCVADKVVVPPPSGKPPSVPPTATLAPPAKTPTPSSEKPPAPSDPASDLGEEDLPYCDEL